jgi:predicted nucleic acid-binding protein
MLVITDTSPLHYLVLIQHSEIIRALFGSILIPPVVAEELQHSSTPPPVRAWMSSPPPWLEIRPPQQTLEAPLLRLGAGERNAILLGREIGADLLLMDDLAGREEAERRAFAVMGTLRVLELGAERAMLLPAAIVKVQATSFYLPVSVVPEMLARDAARKQQR